MSKEKRYIVVKEKSFGMFEDLVGIALTLGYDFVGGVTVDPGTSEYLQAMAKKPQTKKKTK